MSPIVKAGVALGVVVLLFSLVFGFTGMYKNPSNGIVFQLIATAILVACVVWGLKGTAPQRGYGGQVVAALMISLVAAPILIGNSFLNSVLFPDAIEIGLANASDKMAAQGLSDEQIRAQLDMMKPLFSPLGQGIFAAVVTTILSLLTGLIAAVWLKKKDA